jgi:Flavodoxin-like fold
MLRVLILRESRSDQLRRSAACSGYRDLAEKGASVDDCDLYAEGFDPLLRERDWMEYHNIGINRERVSLCADRVIAAQALVLMYQVWNERFPAILKSFLDSCSGSCRTNSPVSPRLDVAFERCRRTGSYRAAHARTRRPEVDRAEFGEPTTCRRLPAFQGSKAIGWHVRKTTSFETKSAHPKQHQDRKGHW